MHSLHWCFCLPCEHRFCPTIINLRARLVCAPRSRRRRRSRSFFEVTFFFSAHNHVPTCPFFCFLRTWSGGGNFSRLPGRFAICGAPGRTREFHVVSGGTRDGGGFVSGRVRPNRERVFGKNQSRSVGRIGFRTQRVTCVRCQRSQRRQVRVVPTAAPVRQCPSRTVCFATRTFRAVCARCRDSNEDESKSNPASQHVPPIEPGIRKGPRFACD